jgi:hypothetical protein
VDEVDEAGEVADEY